MSSCITRVLTGKECSDIFLPMRFEAKQRVPHLIKMIKNSTNELNKKIAYIVIVGVIFSCIEVYFVTKLSFLIPIYACLVFFYDSPFALYSVLIKDSFSYINYALFLKNFVIIASFLPFVLISASGYWAITVVFIFNLFSAIVKIVVFGCSAQRH